MQKWSFFVYGLLCHAMFLVVFLYMAGFLANFYVSKSIDSGTAGPFATALLINAVLLALFGIPHTVMARPTFKKWWTKKIPRVIERSTYVLVSNLLVILLMWQWRPMTGTVWNIQWAPAETALWVLYAFGLLLIVFSSLLINHFDLFGTRQVWLHLQGKEYTHPRFGMPLLYKMVRHPLYVGWLLAFWVTPNMTVGHLVFSIGTTTYILIAVKFEERNLIEFHPEYAEYCAKVPMLIPFTGGRSEGSSPMSEDPVS